MKKLKKINLDQVKEFFFNHGEKVALGVCIFLALCFGFGELLSAMNAGTEPKSGKTWTEELKTRTQQITSPIASLQAPPMDQETKEKLDPIKYAWPPKYLKYQPALYIGVEDRSPSTRRENPFALSIKSGEKNIQLDYVRSLVFMYENERRERIVKGLVDANAELGKAPGGAGPTPIFMQRGDPRRMVVCTAVFPLKEQVEEFRRALKMKNQEELFGSPDDLPKFAGINVVRYEVLDDKTLGKGEVVIAHEPDGKTKMSEKLETLLREAIYDDYTAAALEPYAFNGLITPIPKLAYGSYPDVKLDGIKVEFGHHGKPANPKTPPKGMKKEPDGGGGFKKVGGVVAPGTKPKEKEKNVDPNAFIPNMKEFPISWKDLKKSDPALATRLAREGASPFNPFHALGLFPDKQAQNNGAIQPKGRAAAGAGRYFDAWHVALDEAPDPKGAEPPPAGAPKVFPNWNRDALVRFIDTDVEPGKKYRYAIQVRVLNPNFGKKDEVAFNALAEVEELPPSPKDVNGGWVTTQDITIPHDYYVYAMDQNLLDMWIAGKIIDKADGKFYKDHTFFQVHKWIAKYDNPAEPEPSVIGDWVIAERLPVRRGEYIGLNAEVKVPMWRRMKDAFEVPKEIEIKQPVKTLVPGIKLNLSPPVPDNDKNRENFPPLLVDFHGGKRMNGNVVEEETAVNALVMSADGKLMVFNSRDDTDFAQKKAVVNQRQERVDHARHRLAEAMNWDK